ncbi:MAG: ribbon-helix-helix protein, CopG family [Thermoprotei archaeon]|nr:ribbon-helix-helix protein, CopG family [Thermoprotei archaeon]
MSARFSVSFPKHLLEELERISRSEGISRSSLLQRAAEMYIVNTKWISSEGKVAGAIAIHYNHDVHGLEEKITDIQHEFMDVIISALHIHLTEKNCMLIIAVKGDAERIKHLMTSISKLHGIKTSSFCSISSDID